jgi:predicted permease
VTALRAFVSRLWGSLATHRRDAVLGEEIQTHLELLADEFEARGMSRPQARLAARREFGAVEAIKDATRDARGWPLLESLVQDVRFALRQLRRSPTFTLTAILTLAIGIGGTTAIFSIIDVTMLRSLPYPDADRLVVIQEVVPRFGNSPVSVADADAWRTGSSFDQIALLTGTASNLTGQGEPERLVGSATTPNLLRILGARAQMGRLLLDEEEQAGREHVVVISDAFWRRRFGADPTIVGRMIPLDGVPHEVVGVLAGDFKPPTLSHLFAIPLREISPEIWRPLAIPPEQRQAIGGYSYAAVARLKPGVSLAQAAEELSVIQAALVRVTPGKGDIRTAILPLQTQLESRSYAGLQLLLLAIVAVLVVGCVNIANLLLARIVSRKKEIVVREAIGAGKRRVVRQLLVENVVLGLLGGGSSLAVAWGALRLLVATAPSDIPRLDDVTLDMRVLVFAGAVSLACGLLIALVPLWRAGSLALRESLNRHTGADGRPATIRLQSILVVCEIGLSAACVATAALLLQSFAGLLNVDKGFSADHVLTIDINMAGQRYASGEQRMVVLDEVLNKFQRTAGVAAATVSSQLPLTDASGRSALSTEGVTRPVTDRPVADVRSVTPDYFRTLEVPLRTGRLIGDADRDRHVAVLSEGLAQRGWPNQSPLGRKFRFGSNPAATLYEVVGIAGDVRGTTLDQPMALTAYIPFPQRTASGASLLVKTSVAPAAIAPLLQEIIRRQDPELPIVAVRTMKDVVNASLEPRRFQLVLVALFAVLAALLAGLGVYGVMAYSVAQHAREIGIRLALGAPPHAMLGMVMRNALRLAIGGLLVAMPLALAAGSFLRTFLVGVTPYDPAALVGADAIVLLTALAAAAIPGLRASHIDPMTALRNV